MDGSGTRRLLLAPLGISPVVSVQSVAVNGVALGDDEWWLRQEEACIELSTGSRLAAGFPDGIGNVEVVLDWGYEANHPFATIRDFLEWGYEVAPDDIRLAQAKLAAAELLAASTGERGGVEAVRLGDYSVRYGGPGRFADAVRRLVAEAAEVVDRYRLLDYFVV